MTISVFSAEDISDVLRVIRVFEYTCVIDPREVHETCCAAQRFANHQQGPFVAQDIQRACDWAIGPPMPDMRRHDYDDLRGSGLTVSVMGLPSRSTSIGASWPMVS